MHEIFLGTKKFKVEGYWWSEQEPHFSRPQVNSFKAYQEKLFVLTELDIRTAKSNITHFKGYSTCRICGCRNGSQAHTLDGWVWPEGFRHYIDVHNVKPSAEFIEWLLQGEMT